MTAHLVVSFHVGAKMAGLPLIHGQLPCSLQQIRPKRSPPMLWVHSHILYIANAATILQQVCMLTYRKRGKCRSAGTHQLSCQL